MANIEDAIIAINTDAKFKCKPAGSTAGIVWEDGTSPISAEDLEAKKAELTAAEEAAELQKVTDKASAKAKLIAGEALTEAEADTIVL
tara:strand:+ start:886 stop:1149 length:264 start_codon:yes stop_codon:yes gene_type:complete